MGSYTPPSSMPLRLTLASLALLLGLTACDTASPARVTSDLDLLTPEVIDWRTLSQDPDALVGTWDWVSSIGAEGFIPGEDGPTFGEVVLTPESTGRTETWIFRADGTATILTNGEVTFERAYQVRGRGPNDEGTEDPYVSIQFESGGYGLDFGTDGDVLILDDMAVDGPQSRYRRR